MPPSPSIVHLIAKLDGYSTSVQLRRLAEQQRQLGCRVRVLALSAHPAVLTVWQQRGIDCQRLDCRWALDPAAAWRLARCLRGADHDVLHAWDQTVLRYLMVVQAWVPRTPVIATLWSAPSARVLRASTLVTPLPDDAAWQVIPPALSPLTGPAKTRGQILAEQCLSPEATLIVMAGRLTREKRIEETIWSFELVRNIRENARLLILGDGPARPACERFARLASEAGAIRFLGYQHHPQSYLAEADVFWQAGAADRGTPLAAMEAMAAGVPVVASDCPAHRRVIASGQSGYLVPLTERAVWARQTLKLCENKAHAAAIGGAGQVAVSRHDSADRMGEAYGKLYREVLEMTRKGNVVG